MVNRWVTTLGLIALGFALGAAWDASAESQRIGWRHPGKTVDWQTGGPVRASVRAWPKSTITSRTGDCPLFGDETLDAATSAPDGRFELIIDKNKGTYTVTYCTSGYFPRADRDVPNRENEAEIIPTPAKLMPLPTGNQAFREGLNNAIESELIGALNNLAYLNLIDEKQFTNASSSLASTIHSSSERRASVINRFAELVQEWSN
jgi:hypothetical protein